MKESNSQQGICISNRKTKRLKITKLTKKTMTKRFLLLKLISLQHRGLEKLLVTLLNLTQVNGIM
jgi:hypothetical protein